MADSQRFTVPNIGVLNIFAFVVFIALLSAAAYVHATEAVTSCKDIVGQESETEASEFVGVVATADDQDAIENQAKCEKKRAAELVRLLLLSACLVAIIWLATFTGAAGAAAAVAFAIVAVALIASSNRGDPININITGVGDKELECVDYIRTARFSGRVQEYCLTASDGNEQRRTGPQPFTGSSISSAAELAQQVERDTPLSNLENGGMTIPASYQGAAIKVTIPADAELNIYEFKLEKVSQSGDPSLRVYQSEVSGKRQYWRRIESDDDSGGDLNSRLYISLEPRGEYLIVARNVRSDQRDATVNLNLSARTVVISDLAEEGSTPITLSINENYYQTKILKGRDEYGLVFNLEFDENACVDIYAVETPEAAAQGQTADTEIKVFDAKFVSKAANDDISEDNEASRVTFPVERGEWSKRILVRARDRDNIPGGYLLAARLAPDSNGECATSATQPSWFRPGAEPNLEGFVELPTQ